MIDNKLIIFTNNKRSINVINFLKKKFKIELIVSLFKKTNKELLTKLRKLKIPILFLDKDKKIYDKIKLVNPSFIICAGFTKIIPKKILDQAKISSINLHGGRVPTYLGASTLNWQIINNEKYICKK